MTYREPVVFTPLDLKIGYSYYGGYWQDIFPNNLDQITNNTNMEVLLDSTQYIFDINYNQSHRAYIPIYALI